MAGQSIGDRIVAAQHTIIGSDMSKSVCKATTSEVMGPKKKHLDYLNALTNASNINIPELVDILVERSKQLKWVIVFKSLITTHHLMCYGNERFLQHLASRNSLFTLSNFMDRTGIQGYDMSTYIKRYAEYLKEKAISYRAVAYDFTRIKRGKGGMLRSMDADKLIKALPLIQHQLDALLCFDASPNELTNGVVNAAFLLLFKDLIRLFACYNDGVINLLEKYFTMKKTQCKEALDIYKKFLTRMSKVAELLKVAEQVGIDKGEIPDLTKAPSSLLDALEQHLNALDGKKVDVKIDEGKFNISVDEKLQKLALDEEASKLNAFKHQKETHLHQANSASSTTMSSSSFPTSTVVGSTEASHMAEILDIFNSSVPSSSSNIGQDDFFSFSQPSNTASPTSQPFDSLVLQPTVLGQEATSLFQQPGSSQESTNKNYESSLADVMANLTTRGQKGNRDFEPKTERKLTGGANFAPSMAPTAMTMHSSPMHSMMPAMAPQQPYTLQPASMMGMAPAYAQPGMSVPLGYQQPLMNTMNPNSMQMSFQQPIMNNFAPGNVPITAMGYQQVPPRPLNPNNPFGSM